MKKYLYVLATLFVGVFSSCTDSEEIEVKKDVIVTISPSSVLSAFAGFNSDDLKMYSDEDEGTAQLRITALIYNEDGELVEKKEGLLKDYNQDFVVTLTALDYTKTYKMIVVSSSILGTLSSPKYESYSISDIQELRKLTITQEFSDSFYSNWSILGLARTDINPKEQTDYLVKVSPASAMFIHNWHKIHSWDMINVDSYMFIYHNNDQVSYDNDFIYATTLSTNNNNAIDLDVTQNKSENIYQIFNLLPSTNMHYFGRLFSGEDRMDFSEMNAKGAGNMNVQAGNTYEVDFNCDDFSIDVNTKTTYSGAKASDRDLFQRINNDKISAGKLSMKVVDLI